MGRINLGYFWLFFLNFEWKFFSLCVKGGKIKCFCRCLVCLWYFLVLLVTARWDAPRMLLPMWIWANRPRAKSTPPNPAYFQNLCSAAIVDQGWLRSMALLRPSPIRLKDSTITNIAIPGNTAIHQAEVLVFAIFNKLPQLAASACSQIPRKERKASANTAPDIPNARLINSGVRMLGSACLRMICQWL